MAVYTDNPLVRGLRGKFGKVGVFKQVRGRAILCHPSARPRKQSSEQQDNRELFRRAARYAKAQMASPERKEYYYVMAVRLNLTNAYTAALTMRLRELREKEKPGKVVSEKVKAPRVSQRSSYSIVGNQAFVDFGAGTPQRHEKNGTEKMGRVVTLFGVDDYGGEEVKRKR